MKHLFKAIALAAGVLGCTEAGAAGHWAKVDDQAAPSKAVQLLHPTHYQVYTMDETTLNLQLSTLSADPSEGQIIDLPMPDGTFRNFKVWQTPMMPGSLAAQFPDIKTFTAEQVGDRTITAKLDFTSFGFHAMIYDGDNTAFIDPFDNYHDGYYMVHYKRDETRAMNDRMKCLVHSHDENGPAGPSMDIAQKGLPKLAHRTVNGYQLRTYRLALACDHQYAQAATGFSSPTVAQALSKMTTSMNRINGVYEREFSVTMVFVANENALIFTNAATDPYGADDNNPNALLNDNQTQCDAIIGNANYDIGHVFSTGGGGLSDLGCVCQAGAKAQSCTGSSSPTGDGFDIDYVAHEMGHEYGSDHTFNNNSDGSCGGNAVPDFAYEPGSGTTIMAYAGICDPDDLAYHSDPYFCSSSLLQIQGYITDAAGGDACPVKTATNNKLVAYTAFTNTWSIPYLTPFELTAPTAVDSVADSAILYDWEQYDLGDFGAEFIATHTSGPIFRSFNPSPSPTRIFPRNSMVLAATLSDAGTEGAQGEKSPDVARTLKFKCTFRDIIHNNGCFIFPDDLVTLNAINTGAGFKVTSQQMTGISYAGGSTQTVTWDVVSTNTAPINAANVDIYMSVDGGNTWGYHVGTFPNSGTASVTVPNPATSSSAVRFKVKGSGNVFFNVNAINFTVTYNSSLPVSSGVQSVSVLADDINIFPVPATDVLQVNTNGRNDVGAVVINTIGQIIWQGKISGKADIPTGAWVKGVYHIRLSDAATGQAAVKSFVVE